MLHCGRTPVNFAVKLFCENMMSEIVKFVLKNNDNNKKQTNKQARNSLINAIQ